MAHYVELVRMGIRYSRSDVLFIDIFCFFCSFQNTMRATALNIFLYASLLGIMCIFADILVSICVFGLQRPTRPVPIFQVIDIFFSFFRIQAKPYL